MRYTSTIYKILGLDGSNIWPLGGKLSDFDQNFNFSSQHDAKFYSYDSSVATISFLDNASVTMDRQPTTAQTSAIKLVALYEHTTPMTAKVYLYYYIMLIITNVFSKILKQWDRPDGGLTMLRGEAEMLPNGGVFAGWSDRGYISEFAPDGRCILEATYVGDRFNSYRSYKFDFVGTPTEPPALKTHAYGGGASLASMSSVFAVSWNGATEVASWTFYGSNELSESFQELGTIAESGFETTYISDHLWAFLYARANAANRTSLGSSAVEEIILLNRQVQNIALAGLSVAQNQSERGPAVATTLVALACLILIGMIVMLLFFWRSASCCRLLYASKRNNDNAIEAGEMEALKYDDESDTES
jgi:hypothetical protein